MEFLHSNFSLDNITIEVEGLGSNTNFQKEISYMENKTGEIKSIQTLNYENLKITKRFNSNITSIQGSISKCVLGNNINSIPMKDLLNQIIKVGKELGFSESSIKEGYITKLEFGVTLEVTNPVTLYLDSMLSMKGKNNKRGFQNGQNGLTETVYFLNKSWSFYAYDKTQEAKDKKEQIPSKWGNKHILRLEKKLKSSEARKALLGRRIQVQDINSQEFKEAILQNFLKTYNKINFNNNNLPSIDVINLSLEESLSFQYPKEAMKILSIQKANSRISKGTYYKKINRIKEITSKNNNIKNELDYKLGEIKNNYYKSL